MHSTEPTGLENLAGIVVFVLMAVASLGLVGLAITMAAGAISGRRQLITSWPMEQEHSFSPFEQQAQSANSRAWMWSILASLIVGIFAIGVYFGVTPEIKDITKDMNMSNLSKKTTKADAPAPAPTPAPAAAPAADKPADKPADPPADKK
jgi:hypothetical protein